METDDLRMELHHEVAHFVVEGSSVDVRKRSVAIKTEFYEVAIQALSPADFASAVVLRRLVTEEVCIDGARRPLADGFQLLTRLFHAEQGTSKGTEPSCLRNSDDHIGKR